MDNKIRWGIMGPGSIAHRFAREIQSSNQAELFAVGSRSLERATDFAKQYGMERSYGSYTELVEDPDIDIVYIATPHPAHKECVMLCLKAGKAVLCEKPFTVNASESEEIIQYAKSSGIFLMEAMWTRFLPVTVKIQDWLSKGMIGDVRMVKADFGFRAGWNPEGRLLNPHMAGGALLDVGVYTLSYASMILGDNPKQIIGESFIGETGVDEQFAAILHYPEGRLAVCSAAVRTNLQDDAWIFGTEGKIHIPNFWNAKSATLFRQDEEPELYECEHLGFAHEAEEAMRCLKEGKTESDIMPLDESLAIMKIMDKLRESWHLKYPFE